MIGERQTPTGNSIYSRNRSPPPKAACSATARLRQRPATEISTYGSANGFGWKPNEIIGAQIVSVPTEVPVAIAQQAFRTLLLYLATTFLATMVVIDIGLYYIVILPLRKLAVTADLVSKGDLTQPEFAHKGKDEIAEVAGSFNRMYVSLIKAMKMLED